MLQGHLRLLMRTSLRHPTEVNAQGKQSDSSRILKSGQLFFGDEVV